LSGQLISLSVQRTPPLFTNILFLRGLAPAVMYTIGVAELVLLIGFVIGLVPRLTYGLVRLFHAISTFSSFHQYFHPFESVNLLFFAAWSMLGACFVLYYLRELDMLLRLGSSTRSKGRKATSLRREGIKAAAGASFILPG
jgi:hypothetical protein